ncbi:MAG: HAD family hydrolase [Oscillospiraceae bacterium]|nr:HAD family hydrolase [Oscillospiraceae bacterium]
MKRPKMIIFDAGRTLIDYTNMDTLGDVQALMPYIVENPRNLTAEQINDFAWEVFGQFEAARKSLFEVHEQTILRLVYDTLGIKFSIPMEEVEAIMWRCHPGIVPVTGAAEMLAALNEMGIETAVISNLDFSGYLLQERLDQIFPHNRFRFVVASSDYGIRKPSAMIFQAGITRSGYTPDEIWYVGDKVRVDVDGSRACGMVPVLYKSSRNSYSSFPEELLVVEDYSELITILKDCTT